MDYFLEHIADSIYNEFGADIGDHCIVFQGRRAGLFFHKNLARRLSKPVWAPSIMTINDLFSVFSGLKPAENEILIFELYRVYRSLRENAESFDDFYFWGDMLLNDFDDADKYLVDASTLFSNVTDLKQIDARFGDLTEEQVNIIRTFWTNFNPGSVSDDKTQFMGMWSVLSGIYGKFRTSLAGKNIAYEGMIFRDVIEKNSWKESRTKWKMFHFIGFNALNECEKALMDGLKAQGKARFYWDYDNSYLNPGKINSAGFFIRENLKRFGNDMPPGWKYDTKLSDHSGNVSRTVIETSSDVAQVKLMPELVMGLPGITESNAHETAVVLCDENLLMPVLTSLPEGMPEVNITMGYPLRQTPVYSLVKGLLELQRIKKNENGVTVFGYPEVIRILKNPLLNIIPGVDMPGLADEVSKANLLGIPYQLFEGKGFIGEIFKPVYLPEQLPGYLRDLLSAIAGMITEKEEGESREAMPVNVRNEFIYRVVLSINRLENVSSASDIRFTIETWGKILDRLLRTQSVPFSGEPLTGIQVMGILETRALDFKNLIIMSVNEGLMPSITTASSFIPFSLRQAFGLPSINHQESIYAYHFFRLLHRAENVTFIYNSNSEGARSGELSRFIQQMKYDPALKPSFKNLAFNISNPTGIDTQVPRTEAHLERIKNRFNSPDGKRYLSPSAINMYINCRMKFYYRYVNEIREPDKFTGEIDPAALGSFLHEIMNAIYLPYVGKEVNAEIINRIALPEVIDNLVTEAIRSSYQTDDPTAGAVNERIVKNVLSEYIRRILETDRLKAPFTIAGIEKPLYFDIKISSLGGDLRVRAGGVADRIDRKDGIITIIDYKTGKVSDFIKNFEDLFVFDRIKEHDAWLQTMLYCEAWLAENPGDRIRPSVYRLRNVQTAGFLDIRKEGIIVEDYGLVRDRFIQQLVSAATGIFSGIEPFVMTKNIRANCKWCPYSNLCRR